MTLKVMKNNCTSRLIAPIKKVIHIYEKGQSLSSLQYCFDYLYEQKWQEQQTHRSGDCGSGEGVNISLQEYRSGMLLRRACEQMEFTLEGNTKWEQKMPFAIIKSRSSDFQVTEINSHGKPAFFDKAPKTRWQKIGRQKVMLVEDSNVDFSDPGKTFTRRVLNYGEYARLWGKLSRNEQALTFVLYRERYSLRNVLHRLEYELGVDSNCFSICECDGGSYGCISQYGLCVGLTKEALTYASRHYNLHPLLFDPRSYCELKDVSKYLQPPLAYHYRIVLRCVRDIDNNLHKALLQWNNDGFINYFGIDRFGISDSNLPTIATHIGRGKLECALGCYLQLIANANIIHYHHYITYINAEETSLTGVVEQWLRECKRAKLPSNTIRFMEKLSEYHQYISSRPSKYTASSNDEKRKKILMELLHILQNELRWEEGAAEFVWNAMTSQRILSYGYHVVKGDIVKMHKVEGPFNSVSRQLEKRDVEFASTESYVAKHNYSDSPNCITGDYKLIESDEEASRYSIYDVVLPIPYKKYTEEHKIVYPELEHVNKRVYEQFCTEHSYSFLFTKAEESNNTRKLDQVENQRMYRPIIMRPQNLQISVLHDPSSLAMLKSDYFLRQERRDVNSLELEYHKRVREPCIYNVDKMFAQKISELRKNNKDRCGETTLILSFSLPALSSPLSALRNIFSLTYSHVNDLQLLEGFDKNTKFF